MSLMRFLYMAMYSEMQCFTEAVQEKLPTASAVVSDIVDEVKHLNRNIYDDVGSG